MYFISLLFVCFLLIFSVAKHDKLESFLKNFPQILV